MVPIVKNVPRGNKVHDRRRLIFAHAIYSDNGHVAALLCARVQGRSEQNFRKREKEAGCSVRAVGEAIADSFSIGTWGVSTY